MKPIAKSVMCSPISNRRTLLSNSLYSFMPAKIAISRK